MALLTKRVTFAPHTKMGSRDETKSDKTRCFKCGDFGRTQLTCKVQGWKCFNCNQIVTDHVSKDCPLQNTNNSRCTKRGRGRGRGLTIGGPKLRVVPNEKKASKPTKTKVKMPKKQAQQLQQRVGDVLMTIYEDNEDENSVYVVFENEDEETEEAKYASYTYEVDKDDSYDGDGHERAYNRRQYEGKKLNLITFIVDTGAMEHIINNREWLVNVRRLASKLLQFLKYALE